MTLDTLPHFSPLATCHLHLLPPFLVPSCYLRMYVYVVNHSQIRSGSFRVSSLFVFVAYFSAHEAINWPIHLVVTWLTLSSAIALNHTTLSTHIDTCILILATLANVLDALQLSRCIYFCRTRRVAFCLAPCVLLLLALLLFLVLRPFACVCVWCPCRVRCARPESLCYL